MKIVQVLSHLVSGGAERFTVDLCNELVEMGHEVTLLSLFSLDKYSFYKEDIDSRVKIVTANKKLGIDIGVLFRVHKIIKDIQPDIVNSHHRAFTYLALNILFADKKRTKYFHTVHSTAPEEAGGILNEKLRRLFFGRKYVTPITISSESHASFEQFYGYSAPIIFNGRNIPADLKVHSKAQEQFRVFRKTDKTRVMVQLARFIALKRQDMLARIAKRLQDEGYDFTVLFVGKQDEDIYSRVQAINCSCCYALGELTNPLEYLKAADAFALCSTYEGMPISLIEAMGVSTIPVCTPVGGIVNLIKTGKNGILSDDTSEESYYRAVKQFLEMSDEDITRMKDAALESYKPYSMSECARNYMELYTR